MASLLDLLYIIRSEWLFVFSTLVELLAVVLALQVLTDAVLALKTGGLHSRKKASFFSLSWENFSTVF
jgi:hypothetical protein